MQLFSAGQSIAAVDMLVRYSTCIAVFLYVCARGLVPSTSAKYISYMYVLMFDLCIVQYPVTEVQNLEDPLFVIEAEFTRFTVSNSSTLYVYIHTYMYTHIVCIG